MADQNDCDLNQYWKERGLLAVKPPATPSLSNQKFVKACHFERNIVEGKISTAYGGLTIENYFLSDNSDFLLIELISVLMEIGFQSLIHKNKAIQGFICLFTPKLCDWYYRTYVLIYNV